MPDHTIVSIVSDALRPDRARVRVGDSIYTLDIIDVAKLGLREGQVLTEAELHQLQGESALTTAKDRAMSLLSQRAYTEHEVSERLRRNDYAPECIERVITWLRELGYLDDQAYADQWVQQRTMSKGLGPMRLSHELRLKGVAPEFIHQAIAPLTEDEFTDIAYEQARKRLLREEGTPDEKARARLYGFLQRRGFSGLVIQRVMRRLFG